MHHWLRTGGNTIARELSGTGLRVTMLESGGFMRSLEADALNEVENIGRRASLTSGRP